MNRETTDAEKLKHLPWSIASNTMTAVFCQLTYFGSVFVLFLSELGMTKTQIGSLLSLIPFFAIFALFVAPAVARYGLKRTFLIFYGARSVVTLGLLATPWVLTHYGPRIMLWFVIGIVAAFSLFRSVSVTARYPWAQEFVPNSVRGKYTAVTQIFNGIAGFLAVTLASAFLGPSPNLERFIWLFGAGTIISLISLWTNAFIPGGAPSKRKRSHRPKRDTRLEAIRDTNLLLFLVGVGLVTLADTSLNSFVPLFMREVVGLDLQQIVLLQSATLIGGLVTSYLWGWAADRYGSKPIMLLGAYLRTSLPIFWFVMPRSTTWSFPIALIVAIWQGVSVMGWTIGAARLLFVSVVPRTRRTGYLAVYFAAISLFAGTSQLVGGRLLDAASQIRGQWLGFQLDPYTVLFAGGILLPILAILLLRRVRADGQVSVSQFAGMFLQGRPVLALEALIAFQRSKDEASTVSVTERLGRSDSPLTIDELLESLADPRFNVRLEAIVSLAHRKSEPRFIQALTEVLHGHDPALSTLAAWALGRIGDEQAIPTLRAGLDSRYRSVQAHCARALGTLADHNIAPRLLDRLGNENEMGMSMAYAAALGSLGYQPATHELCRRLIHCQRKRERKEYALALARMVGDEHRFIHLLYHDEGDTGTIMSQATTATLKHLSTILTNEDNSIGLLETCAEKLAQDDLEAGAKLLSASIRQFPSDLFNSPLSDILECCAAQMEKPVEEKIEYLALSLHTLQAEIKPA